MPPISINSDIKKFPLGLRSANTGVCLPILSKSSKVRSTLASWAIASKCKTAFVEPPSAITTAIAFSNACLVIMSLGLISLDMRFIIASPAFNESSNLLDETASCAELLGKLKPSASIADAMVLAVYIPPHDPGPGIAEDSMSKSSISEIEPCECSPTASKTDTTSVLFAPGLILPP